MNADPDRGTTNSSSDSSVDNSWIADEGGTLSGKEDDTEEVMRGFAPIDHTEQYAEVSDLSNNLSSMYLRNSGNSEGVKRYSITKDHTYMIYDFIQDRKHYCIVDIFVPSMGRDKITPKVMPKGSKLSIGMVSPKLFFQYDRLKMANMRNASFNENVVLCFVAFYCVVLCCVVLCSNLCYSFFFLYYIVLFCVLLCYLVFCYNLLCYVSYRFVLFCCSVVYFVLLCDLVMCYISLCYTVLCCSMLCCAVLSCLVLS